MRLDSLSTSDDGPTDRQIGRYLVGARLGSGGAATVYRAYDQIQERFVALKMLPPGADAAVRNRFRQEARTVAGLRHPHIVQTFQVGETASDGGAYIAMELVEGDSLAQLLKRRMRLSVAESCNLLAPIARALDYAHQLDIVHRDVKPSNILLRPVSVDAFGGGPRDSVVASVAASAVHEAERILVGDSIDGETRAGRSVAGLPVAPLLSDFGIARVLDRPELTNAGRTIGTPAYMAPEQCVGSREVTGRADMYALGAVLYRCLVGRPPFTGTTTQILHAHVYAPLSLSNDLLVSLPPEVVDVLRRSLAKEPEERYGNAGEMAEDLTAIATRILSQENRLAEQTATLTLITLRSSELPAPQLQTSGAVIIPGGDTGPATSVSPDVSGAPRKEERPWQDGAKATRRSRTRLMATILGSVLVLALVAVIGPVARNAAPFDSPSPATTTSAFNETARPLLAPAVEAQPAPTAAGPASGATADPQTAAADPPAALDAEPPSACQYQTAAEFDRFLRADDSAARQIGCPKDVPTKLSYEIQNFQTGMALGRLDKPTVYIHYFTNYEWEQREHSWREGMRESSDAPGLPSPPEGLFQPVRGIGQIWAETLFVQQALGWATAQPETIRGVLQSFEGGLLIYNNQTQDTYIFLKSQLRL